MSKRMTFRKKPIALAIAALSAPVATLNVTPAAAQEIEELIVTATRRATSIQEIPINIAALSGTEIEEQGISDLTDLAKWVPGLHIVDQGARAGDMIIVRGLNLENTGSSEGIVDGGGTVATYFGEIPIYIDMKLNDLQRVEALLGPQGTLYGAGTMTGAVRFIPNKPEFDETTLSFRGDTYAGAETDGLSSDLGFTYNTGLSDTWALRVNVDKVRDEGYIDYDFVVREPGISNPDPDWSDPADIAANLMSVEDANWEETLSARIGLRWNPNDLTDVNFTYALQDQEVGGRSISSREALASTGLDIDRYTSGKRVVEPNNRENELFALEIVSDLGFAELTSATGYSKYTEYGQRDQNDLLITLEYSYEAFPEFIAITREDEEATRLNQEIRLVSTGDGPLSWIGGAFYNSLESDGVSKEFVPGLPEWAVANFGGIQDRPDNLEYISQDIEELTETAIFGEITYEIDDRWDVTFGGRYYTYDITNESAIDFPFLFTTYTGDYGPDEINLAFDSFSQDDSGTLFKLNTSYDFTDDFMAYFTFSEGYRIGGTNGLGLCPDQNSTTQNACALTNEFAYDPDSTKNYEIGVHSDWFDGDLILNGAIYQVDWDKPQLGSASVNANIPITKNGEGAQATGVEINYKWQLTEALSMRGSMSINNAELTDDAPDLLRTLEGTPTPYSTGFADGIDGDRLPGSPERQSTLFLSYQSEVMDGTALKLDYGFSTSSDVITKTGLRAGGQELAGYALHNASASLQKDNWTATLYVNNLTNEYVETAAISSRGYISEVADINGDPVIVRSYAVNVLPPRTIGLRFSYDFDL
jgi:iron complex outermembrane recepter protein